MPTHTQHTLRSPTGNKQHAPPPIRAMTQGVHDERGLVEDHRRGGELDEVIGQQVREGGGVVSGRGLRPLANFPGTGPKRRSDIGGKCFWIWATRESCFISKPSCHPLFGLVRLATRRPPSCAGPMGSKAYSNKRPLPALRSHCLARLAAFCRGTPSNTSYLYHWRMVGCVGCFCTPLAGRTNKSTRRSRSMFKGWLPAGGEGRTQLEGESAVAAP